MDGDTEYTDTPHRRRMVTLATFEVADLVDRADRRRLLNDPINPYTRSMAAAANRQIDDVIIAKFDAAAATGVDGSGSENFPSGFDTVGICRRGRYLARLLWKLNANNLNDASLARSGCPHPKWCTKTMRYWWWPSRRG